MVHIKITKGLDIPIKGKPEGRAQPLTLQTLTPAAPAKASLNLDPFEGIRFKLLAKKGDRVKIGQPLLEDKSSEGRLFVSPAGGVVSDVLRGLKRRLMDIIITLDPVEEWHEHGPLDVNSASAEEILKKLKAGGIFSHIRQRPFNILADPSKMPRSIFVKALESAPFIPSAEMQVEGKEEEFQIGLTALSKLTGGAVHLICRKGTERRAFQEAKNVKVHTAEGPHPVSNASLHIQEIDPITSSDDVVWTLNAHDVVSIGHLLKTGRTYIERVIGVGGPAILNGRTGYFRVRTGFPISLLIADRLEKGLIRFIAGDPLMGRKVGPDEFLGLYDYAFSAVPENLHREFMHFFRLGLNKYSFSKAYVSGHLSHKDREYDFSTSLHGEKRAFIDPTLYDQVMPLNVSTMHLVKAVMAEDYDLADELGLLSVDSEDFALPTFVCPSKIEMTEIIKTGLNVHGRELLS